MMDYIKVPCIIMRVSHCRVPHYRNMDFISDYEKLKLIPEDYFELNL